MPFQESTTLLSTSVLFLAGFAYTAMMMLSVTMTTTSTMTMLSIILERRWYSNLKSMSATYNLKWATESEREKWPPLNLLITIILMKIENHVWKIISYFSIYSYCFPMDCTEPIHYQAKHRRSKFNLNRRDFVFRSAYFSWEPSCPAMNQLGPLIVLQMPMLYTIMPEFTPHCYSSCIVSKFIIIMLLHL